MTSFASTSTPPSLGLLRACRRRSEPVPPWLLLSSALVFGLGSQPAVSAFGVLALMLLGLMSWGAGWGAASQATELLFGGGWILAWSGAATVLLLTPGLVDADARAWGAGGAAALGVGLLAAAWRRRSHLLALEPSSRTDCVTPKTVLVILALGSLTLLLVQLDAGGPDWVVMSAALALYGILARRGRATPREVAP